MWDRIEPVRHRQYLLRHTLQQGREPTAREGLFVRLVDINSRRCIYHWSHMCRRPMCHTHHLLCSSRGLVGMVCCLATTLLLAHLTGRDGSMNTSRVRSGRCLRDPSGFDLFQVPVPSEEIEGGRAPPGSPNEW